MVRSQPAGEQVGRSFRKLGKLGVTGNVNVTVNVGITITVAVTIAGGAG